MFASKDVNILKDVKSVNEHKKVEWTVQNPKQESILFSEFDDELIAKMANEELTVHYHQWGIPLEDYESNQDLKNFFKLIQTDTLSCGLKNVVALESYRYPLFGCLYHPEY